MKLERISAYVDVENIASVRILEKCGMHFVNTFMDEGDLCAWYEAINN
jgi:RimJ/RimL family protein N-acetyltransferase